MSDEASFLSKLYTFPPLYSDAIVVLCGEDLPPRLAAAKQLFERQAAPLIVLSGGRHEPPIHTGAVEARKTLLGAGIAPDRMRVEAESQNTWEQAKALVGIVSRTEMRRVLLVASAYHLGRAFLSCIKAMADVGMDNVRVVPVPAPGKWSEKPEGMTRSRDELLAREMGRILAYQNKGDVASYEDGISYLLKMEQPA